MVQLIVGKKGKGKTKQLKVTLYIWIKVPNICMN